MNPDVVARSAALTARIDQVQAELDDVKRQLAAIEALINQDQPSPQHGDRTNSSAPPTPHP